MKGMGSHQSMAMMKDEWLTRSKAKSNGGAPSCLVAYGQNNTEILENCKIPGKLIKLWN